MGVLGKFFHAATAKSREAARVERAPETGSSKAAGLLDPVSLERLLRMVPCNRLGISQLKLLQPSCRPRRYSPGEVIFASGPSDGSAWYLLNGKVKLDFGGRFRTLSGDASMARYPLACGRQYDSTAVAESESSILALPESVMMAALQKKHSSKIQASAVAAEFDQLPEILRQSEVFYTFWRTYEAQAFEFPVLPQLAVRLRSAMEEEIGVREAARIVQTDPIITARLIEISNSPLYLGAAPVTTCQQAITRIGLRATRNLVTSLTLGRLFVCGQVRLQRRIRRLWHESVQLSCLSYVLGRQLSGIDPEQALLSGLMAHIGALPFLYYAADFPPETLPDATLEAAVSLVKGPLGMQLLEAWDFPAEIRRIPLLCEDWFYHGEGPVSLADVVILANWHAHLGRVRMGVLPPIETLPAYQKLDIRRISPEFSLEILHHAKQQIDQVRLFFDR